MNKKQIGFNSLRKVCKHKLSTAVCWHDVNAKIARESEFACEYIHCEAKNCPVWKHFRNITTAQQENKNAN